MRALPDGLAEDGRYSDWLDARQRVGCRHAVDRRVDRRAEAYVHLRARPICAFAADVRVAAFPRRGRRSYLRQAMSGRRLPDARREGAVSDPQVQLTIDGLQVSVPAGTTVFDAARMNGIPIPTLCHQQNETPVGVCRVCVVDVGARVFAASCVRPAENNMVVNTSSDKVKRSRRTLIEMLMADHPSPCARERQSNDC